MHGTGHFVAKQPQTARRLLAMEGIGVATLIGSVGGIAGLGAARRYAAPLIHLTISGAGFFALSALSDIYGVLAPSGGTGSPFRMPPWFEAELGVRRVENPSFAFHTFAVQGADLRLGSFHLSQSAWFALDDPNSRFRVLGGYRFFGPTPSRAASSARDGSFFDLETALTHHRYTSHGFSVTTAEASLSGRLDLQHIGPTLQGAFAELSLGAGIEDTHYSGLGDDGGEILLGRFAFGLYMGHQGYPRGEAALYYDHRHDGFAAGLKTNNVGSGPLGHFGALSRVYLSPHFGVLVDAQMGSAAVLGVSLLIRQGGRP